MIFSCEGYNTYALYKSVSGKVYIFRQLKNKIKRKQKIKCVLKNDMIIKKNENFFTFFHFVYI